MTSSQNFTSELIKCIEPEKLDVAALCAVLLACINLDQLQKTIVEGNDPFIRDAIEFAERKKNRRWFSLIARIGDDMVQDGIDGAVIEFIEDIKEFLEEQKNGRARTTTTATSGGEQ